MSVCFAQAMIHSCSEDPESDACVFLYDTARISRMINTTGGPHFSAPETADVIRKASPEHQRRIAQWLTQFRDEWRFPEIAIDEELRRIYHMSVPDMRKLPEVLKLIANAPMNRIKRNVFSHEKEIRQAAAMTYFQYDQYRKEHPDFLDADIGGLDTPFLASNSSFFATVDGLLIVAELESYRCDHGEYPESLTPLVPQYMPELPKNPYDGQDFTYNRADGAYFLHCVGGHRTGDTWEPYQHFLVYAPKDQRTGFWRKLDEERHKVRREQRDKTSR